MNNHCGKASCVLILGLAAAPARASGAQPAAEKLWEFAAGARIEHAPAIAKDGTVYFVIGDTFSPIHKLMALNPDGTRKWEAGSNMPFAAGPSVGSDGTIYVGSMDKTLHAYQPNGTVKWRFPGNAQGFSTAGSGADGTVYFGSWDLNLYAVNPDGTQKWAFDAGAYADRARAPIVRHPPAIGHDGTIYLGTGSSMFPINKFFALQPDGSLKWEAFVGSSPSPPAIGDDGTIYFTSNDGIVHALNNDGSKKWALTVSAKGFGDGPAIGPDGTVYVGSLANKLVAINPDGIIKWEFATASGVATTPAIDQDGALFFATSSHEFYCVNPDGSQRWVFAGPRTSAAISPDGAVYVGSWSGTLFALKGGRPLANSPWPMYGRDAQHTGRADGSVLLRVSAQPKDQNVAEGQSATFSVVAAGDPPLQYQWKFNGNGLAGATNSTLNVRVVRESHAGTYQAVVSNAQASAVSAPARLTVLPPVSFVERALPSAYYAGTRLEVMLSATPPTGVSVYAVEDHPPLGWAVGNIRDGGLYDASNHKVKFGPFFDDTPRKLAYELIPPLLGEGGPRTFAGVGSMEGIGSPVTGSSTVDLKFLLHPADNSPGDNRITIDEVTGYAAAWRRGEPWPIAPNPIPIDYVTRAATLWKTSESYLYDPNVTPAVLRWIPSAERRSSVAGQSLRKQSDWGQIQTENTVTSELPVTYVPTEAFIVAISVRPKSDVGAYAVQDQPAAGWSVDDISQGGVHDFVHDQVKWGPFFDNSPRLLTYRATPAATAAGDAAFEGLASFDGGRVAVSGVRRTRAASRLRVDAAAPGREFRLVLRGEIGVIYDIEASDDLKRWTLFRIATNHNGTISLPASGGAGENLQFYRARRR